ncbi:MAG: ankyrin repeat domain-containing protein [Magnetococcales bacterium]|nr:ankyrin repeat domain-containing protein [Magnetococcales bacterium]
MSLFRFIPMTLLLLSAGFLPVGTVMGEGGHVTYATTMLDHSPNPVNQKFRSLISQNQISALRSYIASGVDINTMDAKRVSPIHYAAYLGNIEALRVLILRGVNLDAAAFGSWTPLHYAAFGGHVEACNLLAAMGIPIDATDIGGETPLFYAIESGNLRLVKWFVEHGANVHHTNNDKETPIALAAKEGEGSPITKYLQEVGKQFEGKTGVQK